MTSTSVGQLPVASITLSDDVGTPGGRAPVVLDPLHATPDGAWTSYAWPEPDTSRGTLVALRLPFPAEPGQRYLANGWQSWSAPTVRTLGHPDAPRPLPGLSRRHLLRMAGAGDSSYDFFATADAVAGFRTGGGLLIADVRDGAMYAVRRHVGAPQPPVLVATGDGAGLVDDLLDRTEGHVPVTKPVGWSTWEAFWARIDEDRISHALAEVGALASEDLCDMFLIDDGWQRTLGDWVADPGRFPAGLSALADQARSTGLAAGLWTAPLLVDPGSCLVENHPDWVARNPDGRPAVGADIEHWGGRMWVLDVTRPAVREHVTAVAAAHAAAGFTTFKLDFLYAAVEAADAAIRRCQAGLPHTGDVLGPDEVTAATLDAIRAGAGDSVTLLGCGAPLWPSIGRVDWMRVGPDVTRYYRPRKEPHSDPAMVSCLRNGWRAAALRTPMHRRLWGNDPDSLVLSATASRLTPEKRLGFARWVAASGQLLVLSDDVGTLAPSELEEWRRAVTRSRQVPPRPAQRALAGVLAG